MALGAFDERDGVEVPVAFVIAEVSRLEDAQVGRWHQWHWSLMGLVRVVVV